MEFTLDTLSTQGIDIPEICVHQWEERGDYMAVVSKFTKAKQKLFTARMEFFEAIASSSRYTARTVITCPYGSFFVCIFTYTVPNGSVLAQMCRFYGNERPTQSRYKKPFIGLFAEEERDIARKLADCIYFQNEAKPTPNPFKVDDVLVASGGYEQTTINYYQVTKVSGKTVCVREIDSVRVENSDTMTGTKAPLVGQFTGEELKRQVKNDRIKITDYSNAYKLSYKVVGGVKIYESSSFTFYG